MKTKFLLLLGAFVLLTSSQQLPLNTTSKSRKGMIKVTILYPNRAEGTFNMDYYSEKHMPMVASLLEGSLKFWEIDKGLGGRTPNDSIPYLAIGYLYFHKLSDYQDSFAPHAAEIVNDIPNYTNITPIIQISEVYR